MSTVKMRAPAGTIAGSLVQTEYGNYTVGTDLTITADTRVRNALEAAGWFADRSTGVTANGIAPRRMNLLSAFCVDGAPLAAAAAASDFGVSCTPGTAMYLIGEAAQNNTKTDQALWEFVLPDTYVAGTDLSVTINADYDGTGTVGTKTIDVSAYEQAVTGTGTTDICATAAQTLTATAANYTFTLTGTNLAPGDQVLVVVTTALSETVNSSSVNSRINSVIIS